MEDDPIGEILLVVFPIWLIGVPAAYLTFVINWFYPIFEDVFKMSVIIGFISAFIIGIVFYFGLGGFYE